MSTSLILNRISTEKINSRLSDVIKNDDLTLFIDEFLESPIFIFTKIIKSNDIVCHSILFWSKKILNLLINIRDQFPDTSVLYMLWQHRHNNDKIFIDINKSLVLNKKINKLNTNWEYINYDNYIDWLHNIYKDIIMRKNNPQIDEKLINDCNNRLFCIIANDEYYDRLYN